jgi:hypothetical protein
MDRQRPDGPYDGPYRAARRQRGLRMAWMDTMDAARSSCSAHS